LLGPFIGLMPQLDPTDWEALGAAVQIGGTHTGDPTQVSTATLALLRNLRRTAGTVVPAAAATDSRDIPA